MNFCVEIIKLYNESKFHQNSSFSGLNISMVFKPGMILHNIKSIEYVIWPNIYI